MGYAVFHISDEEHAGIGLTLAEAFTRIMALSHCDYIFHRIDGVMHLDVHHRDPVLEFFGCDEHELRARYYPDYQSRLVDDAMARAEIMRKFVIAGFKGYHVVRDNYPSFGALSERSLREIKRASAAAR
jgi:hypothetical protein